MTRKFKTLGVALLAVLALTAVSASAASAERQYTASAYPTTGTATSPVGNGTFITEGGTVECAAHFQGTLSAASSSLRVTPTYTGCKTFGFLNAAFHINGCSYLFTTPTKTATEDVFNANVDIACPAGKSITITAGTCEITIPAQTNLPSVTLTNDTAAGDVTVKADITNKISYTVVNDGFGCPFAGTGPKGGGSYIQDAPITFDAVSPSASRIDIG